MKRDKTRCARCGHGRVWHIGDERGTCYFPLDRVYDMDSKGIRYFIRIDMCGRFVEPTEGP